MTLRSLLPVVLTLAVQAQTLVQQGLQELKRGELVQARTDLESASKAEPSNAVVWTALTEVYVRLHQPELAVSASAAAEKNGRGNPVIEHALAIFYSEEAFPVAQALLEKQDFAAAAQLLEMALARLPRDPQLTLALGVARYGQRRFDEAIELFLKVIRLDPKVEQPYSFLGRMLDQAGPKLPEIEDIFSKRAIDRPDNAQAQFLLAKVLLTANAKDPKAEPLLRKSIELEPDRWESHYELGALLAGRHDYAGAEKELERSIALNPNQPNAHYQLARVYDRLGEPEKAKAEREIHSRLTTAGSSGMQ
jgi:tetratricopeptide (TPR) repeat protein